MLLEAVYYDIGHATKASVNLIQACSVARGICVPPCMWQETQSAWRCFCYCPVTGSHDAYIYPKAFSQGSVALGLFVRLCRIAQYFVPRTSWQACELSSQL